MASVARENIGLLNDKITVKLSKDDYLPGFEKKLKDYSKNANIPGFRKGMVPTGMVKKMYGSAIYTEEVLKTAEKELYTYLQKEQPDIFAQPLALETGVQPIDFNNPAEYEFGFEIGLKPEFELAPLAKAKLTLHKVKVTDQMVQEETSRLQIKGGKMTEPEKVDNDENVLNVQLTETDKDGNSIEGGISKANSLMLKYFSPALKQQLTGKVKDDSLVFQLAGSFEGDKLAAVLEDLGFAKEDTAAAEKYFKLTIEKIGLVEKRELNEEFFNEVFPGAAIATEEEFRNKLKEEIQQYWDSQSRNQLHDQLYHYLLDETKMEFPAEFLKRWLQINGEQRKSAEEVEAEFPVFTNQLKWTLISDKIIKDNQLDVSQQELKDSLKAQVMGYFGGASLGDDTSWIDSYVERMMKDEKQLESTYRRLVTEKLFGWAQAQVTPAEKEVTPEELNGLQHHHHH
ncbi:MAG TPA: trigger factor [Ferruginibacter sp.]|nr:trigger factor [Ferruginibacter sp.]HMP19907.1 trigger factor [Ferruginibacter sp.]